MQPALADFKCPARSLSVDIFMRAMYKMYMTRSRPRNEPTREEIRRLAYEADVDPRTARRALRGENIHGAAVASRIEKALEQIRRNASTKENTHGHR